ncbi:MAG: UDP-N-acetylglucosamine 2-epimerase [Saprospiraceae bacterium]|nr:UDP-N-acetylglucosamine 2-epimerase [Saprospiraceae bacterium]
MNEIIKDDLLISDRIYNLINTNDKIGRIVLIGNQINGIAQSLNNLQPDIVLVAGDREEAISTTMSAAFLDIPVAHFFWWRYR